MQYIRLNDDHVILHLSSSLVTVTRNSFNFNKINKFLDENASEEDIAPLLKPVELPNGIFETYISNDDVLYYNNHITGKPSSLRVTLSGDRISEDKISSSRFLGVYASLDDILLDWPEHAI